MDTVQNILDTANLNMARFVANPYISAILLIIFLMYAGMAAPALPQGIAKLFDYTIFKIFWLALILFVFNFNPAVAIIMAIAFFVSLQTLSRWKLFNFAGDITKIKKMANFSQTEQQTPTDATNVPNDDTMYGLTDPSDANMDTQVSGLAARTPYYDGPQGMEHPVGFSNDMEQGADVNF